ncbi:hypothetical protein [Haloparvum sp. AD34]
MSMRNAFQHNKFVLGGVVAFAIWTVLTFINVATSMGPLTLDNWVGQHGVGGVIGLVALAIVIGLALTTYGTLAEDDPAPEEWPPESAE